jgi:hypothetical protein
VFKSRQRAKGRRQKLVTSNTYKVTRELSYLSLFQGGAGEGTAKKEAQLCCGRGGYSWRQGKGQKAEGKN